MGVHLMMSTWTDGRLKRDTLHAKCFILTAGMCTQYLLDKLLQFHCPQGVGVGLIIRHLKMLTFGTRVCTNINVAAFLRNISLQASVLVCHRQILPTISG